MPQTPVRRDTSQPPDVGGLVRLHHRRRGWAWVAVASTVGLAMYAGVDAGLFGSLTGTAETFSAIPVLVLLALIAAGLVVVIADTSRIHRADAAARVRAKGKVSHDPLYAHAHRYPPHHRGSWVFIIVMLVAMTGISVALLPAQVNSWAYLAGAENKDTFNPVAYGQACRNLARYSGCNTVTEGYLANSGASVTWGSRVPLGQPFSARDPLWAWGSGRSLISGNGPAIGTVVAGLFFDGMALLLLYILVIVVRPGPAQRLRRPAGRERSRR
jgi:hypothetical protein